jgi:hypothetical protein
MQQFWITGGDRISLITRQQIHPDCNLDKDNYMNGIIMEFVPNKGLFQLEI